MSSTTSSPTTRLMVLISGNGTNLQALIDACKPSSPLAHCTITRILSNRKGAYGLTRAKNANIPTTYHNLLTYTKKHPESARAAAREEYDADLAKIVVEEKPHVVVCAGWMHILTPSFLDPVAAAGIDVINLHPALPDAYNGANAIERAHADWMAGKITKTGIMIHRVVAEVDMGEPLLVKEIEFKTGDEDVSVLEERVHSVEWKAIVEGTALAVAEFWKKKGTPN